MYPWFFFPTPFQKFKHRQLFYSNGKYVKFNQITEIDYNSVTLRLGQCTLYVSA